MGLIHCSEMIEGENTTMDFAYVRTRYRTQRSLNCLGIRSVAGELRIIVSDWCFSQFSTNSVKHYDVGPLRRYQSSPEPYRPFIPNPT